MLASLYWEGPNELPLRRSSRSAPRRDIAEPGLEAALPGRASPSPSQLLAFAQGKEQTAEAFNYLFVTDIGNFLRDLVP